MNALRKPREGHRGATLKLPITNLRELFRHLALLPYWEHGGFCPLSFAVVQKKKISLPWSQGHFCYVESSKFVTNDFYSYPCCFLPKVTYNWDRIQPWQFRALLNGPITAVWTHHLPTGPSAFTTELSLSGDQVQHANTPLRNQTATLFNFILCLLFLDFTPFSPKFGKCQFILTNELFPNAWQLPTGDDKDYPDWEIHSFIHFQ